jgi:2-dehydro-3-deoxyphosphogalactonate aldolase
MSNLAAFEQAFTRCPLIAILRGVRPDEVATIGEALVGEGFTLIEVPLNSPDPFVSIARLAQALEGHAMIGAGTVLTPQEARQVGEAGGGMVISPNADRQVIAATCEAGLVSLPGIATPSEAFAALQAGAHALKLFPAEGSSPKVLKAMRAVLPHATRVLPVGGISPDGMTPWLDAGATGFGLGSALYRAGDSASAVAMRARNFLDSWSALRG